jgi:hypothetical protein
MGKTSKIWFYLYFEVALLGAAWIYRISKIVPKEGWLISITVLSVGWSCNMFSLSNVQTLLRGLSDPIHRKKSTHSNLPIFIICFIQIQMVELPWGANESTFQKRRIELSNTNADPITLKKIKLNWRFTKLLIKVKFKNKKAVKCQLVQSSNKQIIIHLLFIVYLNCFADWLFEHLYRFDFPNFFQRRNLNILSIKMGIQVEY